MLKLKFILGDDVIRTEASCILAKSDLKQLLGEVLYGFETMGYDFNTDCVYQSCMSNYREEEIKGNKFTELYSSDIISVYIKTTGRVV